MLQKDHLCNYLLWAHQAHYQKTYQRKVYCTTELSENLWKGQEILRIAKMLIQFTTTVILGHYPCIFGNFIEQSLKNYEWKHFCYNIRKYFWTNLEVRDVAMD